MRRSCCGVRRAYVLQPGSAPPEGGRSLRCWGPFLFWRPPFSMGGGPVAGTPFAAEVGARAWALSPTSVPVPAERWDLSVPTGQPVALSCLQLLCVGL